MSGICFLIMNEAGYLRKKLWTSRIGKAAIGRLANYSCLTHPVRLPLWGLGIHTSKDMMKSRYPGVQRAEHVPSPCSAAIRSPPGMEVGEGNRCAVSHRC